MLEPLALEIEGFRSFRAQQRIDLQSRGVVFISGENRVSKKADSNGSGKSSIIEALLLALFNETLNGKNLINKRCEAARVRLHVRQHDGSRAVIENVRRRRGGNSWLVKTPNGASEGGTEVVLGNAAELVPAMLGIAFDGFVNSVIYGQSKLKFSQMTDAQRKRVLDDVIDTAIFAAKRRVVEEARKTLQTEVGELDFKARLLTENVDSHAEYVATHRNGTQEAIRDEITAMAELVTASERAHTLFMEYAALRRAHLSAAVEDGMVDVTRELEAKIAEVDRTISRLLEEQQRTLALDVCPTCRRPVKDAVALIEAHYTEKLTPLTARAEWLRRHFDASRAPAQPTDADWPIADLLRTMREEMRLVLDTLIEPPVLTPDTEACDHFAAALDKLRAELRTVTEARTLAEESLDVLELWYELLGPAGVRTKVLARYEQFINERLKLYAAALCAGEVTISFSAQRMLKRGALKNEILFEASDRTAGDSYEDFSSGEQERVDRCFMFALQDVVRRLHSSRFPLAAYDEIFDHLDETGCEAVMTLLAQLRHEVGTVLVISQNAKLLAHASDAVIRVIKGDDGSVVEEV